MQSVSFSLEHALAPEAEHVEATAFQASEMTEAGAQVDSLDTVLWPIFNYNMQFQCFTQH